MRPVKKKGKTIRNHNTSSFKNIAKTSFNNIFFQKLENTQKSRSFSDIAYSLQTGTMEQPREKRYIKKNNIKNKKKQIDRHM